MCDSAGVDRLECATQIYELRQQGLKAKELSILFGINITTVNLDIGAYESHHIIGIPVHRPGHDVKSYENQCLDVPPELLDRARELGYKG